MRKIASCLTAFCLATLTAAPAQAAGSCYLESDLAFFQQVVELVSSERKPALGCWVVRLRLRKIPEGHAMACGVNACSTRPELTEGIYWWEGSPANENIGRVVRVENGSCTDVSFCIVPQDPTETSLIDFAALYEEGYHIPPITSRPRWNHGAIDLSSLDGLKSHCQDGEPRGAICL
jgi:hypothetical protein